MSKARHQAALKWAAAGRASQARARAHLKPLPTKKPALPDGSGGLHGGPVCAAVAVAEHLAASTGVVASELDTLALAARVAGGVLGDYLEAVAEEGLAGVRLARWRPCDEDAYVPGLVYGVELRGGYHAVLAAPEGVWSWGMLWPCFGRPVEAWQLEWET